jgi:hypothetical protein
MTIGISGRAPQYAWIFLPDQGVTKLIGLPDSTDIGLDNSQLSQDVVAVTSSNMVVGTSFRSPSGSHNGKAVWLYRPEDQITNRIGFFDVAHTLQNGDKVTLFEGVNANDLVVGRSQFQSANTVRDNTWVYDPATNLTTSIGFANPSDAADRSDTIIAITDQNLVIGRTVKSGFSTPWIYDHSSAHSSVLGLFDAEHTNSEGESNNRVVDYTESGYVLGAAERFIGSVPRFYKVTPWVFNPTSGEIQSGGLTEGN